MENNIPVEDRREDPTLDADEEKAMDRALDERGKYEAYRKVKLPTVPKK